MTMSKRWLICHHLQELADVARKHIYITPLSKMTNCINLLGQ